MRIPTIALLCAALLVAGCTATEPKGSTAGHAVPAAMPQRSYQPTVTVSDSRGLTAALKNAKAGDVIRLADGTYAGTFVLSAKGTSQRPIVVTGSAKAVLDGGGVKSGYGFHLMDSAFVVLQGFTVTNAQKGIVVDHTSSSTIDAVTVRHIGDEAIHLRDFSSDNVVQGSSVSDTGLRRAAFGEGIYLGSAESNWKKISGGQPDASLRNRVIGNHIGPDVRAEGIDIKEGTSNGEIRGNTFDGHGIAGENHADSWIDVKGNAYVIAANRGSYLPALPDGGDGFQTHVVDKAGAYGRMNVFTGNTADLGDATGYGFRIDAKGPGNIVCADNKVTAAEAGVANVPVAKSCPAH
ncbi:right-handed parallel beta-helix repeat-containing protein [Fodinicola acaciae]|uniref:right-handed parallel beta-helix repeat-containing protein n=1 Tax=Fodinicola acaciae TaxID=2681555 RepID=UPI0013D052CA|nr:right-handed parallel beta-helix repeat-containing protein [Fodinicola acaciae]